MSSPATLTCKECNYDNELQRIHCHQCGSKLDRSAAFNEDQKRKSENDRAKRVKKIAGPKRNLTVGPFLRGFVKVAIRAAATAAVILIALPPDNLPPRLEPSPSGPSAAASLTALSMASAGRQALLNEASLNDFFRTSVQLKLLEKYVVFKRVFTDLEDHSIRILIEAEVLGYSLYSGIAYDLKIENGKLTPIPKGSNFGRLTLPPAANRLTEKLYAPIWAKLSSEREQLDKLAAIEVRKDGIVLTAKGNTPSRSPLAPSTPLSPTSPPSP